ncbi:MAG: hypothetical protein ACPGJS_05120 [Flammeovirgaceae bacterium]
MKTSWTETARIEDYLTHQEDIEGCLLLEAQLQLDAELAQRIAAQQASYALIQAHGRQLLRKEIKAVEHKIFHDTCYASFKKKIRSFFS